LWMLWRDDSVTRPFPTYLLLLYYCFTAAFLLLLLPVET
jgi:hypothetical protein